MITKQKPKKERGIVAEISPGLIEIFEKIKNNIKIYARNSNVKISNLAASDVLAKRVIEAKWYP